jgi:hypothetical protein
VFIIIAIIMMVIIITTTTILIISISKSLYRCTQMADASVRLEKSASLNVVPNHTHGK